MFSVAAGLGGLEVQLVYYRGASECRASGYVSDAARLATLMVASPVPADARRSAACCGIWKLKPDARACAPPFSWATRSRSRRPDCWKRPGGSA